MTVLFLSWINFRLQLRDGLPPGDLAKFWQAEEKAGKMGYVEDENFWLDCPLVEKIPGKVSGLVLLRGTRVQADTIVECTELGDTPEQIASDYRLKLDDVRAVLAYVARHETIAPRQ